MNKQTNLVTTAQAATQLGLTYYRVIQFIHGSRLPAVKLGRDWLIQQKDLDKFAAIPRKTGRPRKAKNDG